MEQRKRRVSSSPLDPVDEVVGSNRRKQLKMEIDQEKSKLSGNGQMDIDRLSSELTQDYCKRRETRVNEILQFSEYEQIDFVRTLMQHMSHHQLGVIDTTLQVRFKSLKNIKTLILSPFYNAISSVNWPSAACPSWLKIYSVIWMRIRCEVPSRLEYLFVSFFVINFFRSAKAGTV